MSINKNNLITTSTAYGPINMDTNIIFRNSDDFSILKRQVKLLELSISSLEDENEKLKSEIKEIKKFIYNK